MKEESKRDEAKRALKKLRRVGNSHGIILPKQMLQGMANENAIVQLVRIGAYIIISPWSEPIKVTEKRLKEALQEEASQ